MINYFLSFPGGDEKLDPNSTVQSETTFTLSHQRAICDKATFMCALIQSHDQFFSKTEKV